MRPTEKFIYTFGESIGAVLVMSVVYGVFWFIFKTLLLRLLKFLGIEYFAEIKSSYEWIGKTVIESRAVLGADKACFYRCSNGEAYIQDDPLKNINIRIESVVNITKNRGVSRLPDELDDRYYELFQQIESKPEYTEFFVTDESISSQLRNELQKNDVLSYMAVKIRNGKELYGIIIYTWHHVTNMPKQLLPKFNEHLQYVKSSILDETLFIVSKSPRYRIQNITAIIKNKFRRKQ